MMHSELVQTATDLLSETRYSTLWLSEYDQALASDSDALLNTLIGRLLLQQMPQRMAA